MQGWGARGAWGGMGGWGGEDVQEGGRWKQARVRVAGGGREGRGEHLREQQRRCRRSSRGFKIIIDHPLLPNGGVQTCVHKGR